MNPTILITNDGPHSAETWAELTASQIVDVAPNSANAESLEFRVVLLALLTTAHSDVQERERKSLDRHGTRQLSHAPAIAPRVDDTVDAIVAASRGRSFAKHFASPDTRDYLRRLLSEHFTTVVDIERKWFVDRADARQE